MYQGTIISKTFKELQLEPLVGMLVAFYTSTAKIPEWYLGYITNDNYKPLVDDGERWVFVEGAGIFASYKISDIQTLKVGDYCLDYNYWWFAIKNNLLNTNTIVNLSNPLDNIVRLIDVKKIHNIEVQLVSNYIEAMFLHEGIRLAFESGYTTVYDHWGHNAWDEYTIIEALERFKPMYF